MSLPSQTPERNGTEFKNKSIKKGGGEEKKGKKVK